MSAPKGLPERVTFRCTEPFDSRLGLSWRALPSDDAAAASARRFSVSSSSVSSSAEDPRRRSNVVVAAAPVASISAQPLPAFSAPRRPAGVSVRRTESSVVLAANLPPVAAAGWLSVRLARACPDVRLRPGHVSVFTRGGGVGGGDSSSGVFAAIECDSAADARRLVATVDLHWGRDAARRVALWLDLDGAHGRDAFPPPPPASDADAYVAARRGEDDDDDDEADPRRPEALGLVGGGSNFAAMEAQAQSADHGEWELREDAEDDAYCPSPPPPPQPLQQQQQQWAGAEFQSRAMREFFEEVRTILPDVPSVPPPPPPREEQGLLVANVSDMPPGLEEALRYHFAAFRPKRIVRTERGAVVVFDDKPSRDAAASDAALAEFSGRTLKLEPLDKRRMLSEVTVARMQESLFSRLKGDAWRMFVNPVLFSIAKQQAAEFEALARETLSTTPPPPSSSLSTEEQIGSLPLSSVLSLDDLDFSSLRSFKKDGVSLSLPRVEAAELQDPQEDEEGLAESRRALRKKKKHKQRQHRRHEESKKKRQQQEEEEETIPEEEEEEEEPWEDRMEVEEDEDFEAVAPSEEEEDAAVEFEDEEYVQAEEEEEEEEEKEEEEEEKESSEDESLSDLDSDFEVGYKHKRSAKERMRRKERRQRKKQLRREKRQKKRQQRHPTYQAMGTQTATEMSLADEQEVAAQLLELHLQPHVPAAKPVAPPPPALVGFDAEDAELLRRAFAELEISGKPATLEELFTVLPPPSPETSNVCPSGCARTELYRRGDKKQLVGKGKSRIDTQDRTLGPATAAPESRRTQRLQQRQAFASEMMTDLETLAFYRNQLNPRKKRLKFERSKIHGWGLFTLENIAANDVVTEYVGLIVRSRVADRLEEQYNAAAAADGSSYMFRIDSDLIVDATTVGNLSRFINHSCDPNCYAKIILVGAHKRIVIYSKRDIARGEEITYDYKFPCEDIANRVRCTCGAHNCRRWLNWEEQR